MSKNKGNNRPSEMRSPGVTNEAPEFTNVQESQGGKSSGGGKKGGKNKGGK